MKHLLILALLIIPVSSNHTIVDELEQEIKLDNPKFNEWSWSLQEEVKRIYIEHSYRR